MLSGYRLLVLALGLTLTAACQSPANDKQAQKANSLSKVEQTLFDIGTSLRYANRPSELDKPCEQGQENRSSDLCAQWRAADAAWLFGTLGAIIGFLTLAAAGAAAFYAKKAAEHTERGADEASRAADAAETAIGETKSVGVAQVRCYLTVQAASIVPKKDGGWYVYFDVTNSGNSPAVEVSCSAQVRVMNTATKLVHVYQSTKDSGVFLTDISANTTESFGPIPVDFQFTPDEIDNMTESFGIFFEILAIVSANDVFGGVASITQPFVKILYTQPIGKLEIPRAKRVRLFRDEKN